MSIPGFNPVEEGAVSRFSSAFLERAGEDSGFVRALSDLWTIAMTRLLEANGLIDPDRDIVLVSNDEAVSALRALTKRDDRLKKALFEAPFGFAAPDAIERAFDDIFGDGVYAVWREAFELEDFDHCFELVVPWPD